LLVELKYSDRIATQLQETGEASDSDLIILVNSARIVGIFEFKVIWNPVSSHWTVSTILT